MHMHRKAKYAQIGGRFQENSERSFQISLNYNNICRTCSTAYLSTEEENSEKEEQSLNLALRGSHGYEVLAAAFSQP